MCVVSFQDSTKIDVNWLEFGVPMYTVTISYHITVLWEIMVKYCSWFLEKIPQNSSLVVSLYEMWSYETHDVVKLYLYYVDNGNCINSPVNIWYDLKQIATEFFFVGMHLGEVSLEHTKNPLRHLWGKQVKSAIKVTFSH